MPGSPIDVEVALLNLVRAVGDEPALAPFRQARRGAGRRERIGETSDLFGLNPLTTSSTASDFWVMSTSCARGAVRPRHRHCTSLQPDARGFFANLRLQGSVGSAVQFRTLPARRYCDPAMWSKSGGTLVGSRRHSRNFRIASEEWMAARILIRPKQRGHSSTSKDIKPGQSAVSKFLFRFAFSNYIANEIIPSLHAPLVA
jgi:hypothetical protein